MPSFGETATTIGVTAGIKFADLIMTQYREQGAFFHRGYTLKQVLDQCTGNLNDVAKGRQMPVHYGSKELNMAFVSSPLATQISHAAGAGYGYRLRGEDKICVCWFGEGAASEGDFHAGMNFAKTLSCQTLFVARNNKYAISTHSDEQFHGDGISARGIGYGMKTIRVDGNDAVAVVEATKMAREYIMEKKQPVLLEAMTYRVGDHSTSDYSALYRELDEIDSWTKANDPIVRLTLYLKQQKKMQVTEEEIEKIRADTQKEVLKELKRAALEKMPNFTSMFTDVYDELTPNLVEQKEELIDLVNRYPEEYNPSRYEKEN